MPLWISTIRIVESRNSNYGYQQCELWISTIRIRDIHNASVDIRNVD
jgi:hypothetical protein